MADIPPGSSLDLQFDETQAPRVGSPPAVWPVVTGLIAALGLGVVVFLQLAANRTRIEEARLTDPAPNVATLSAEGVPPPPDLSVLAAPAPEPEPMSDAGPDPYAGEPVLLPLIVLDVVAVDEPVRVAVTLGDDVPLAVTLAVPLPLTLPVPLPDAVLLAVSDPEAVTLALFVPDSEGEPDDVADTDADAESVLVRVAVMEGVGVVVPARRSDKLARSTSGEAASSVHVAAVATHRWLSHWL